MFLCFLCFLRFVLPPVDGFPSETGTATAIGGDELTGFADAGTGDGETCIDGDAGLEKEEKGELIDGNIDVAEGDLGPVISP